MQRRQEGQQLVREWQLRHTSTLWWLETVRSSIRMLLACFFVQSDVCQSSMTTPNILPPCLLLIAAHSSGVGGSSRATWSHRERAADPDIDARQAFRQAVQAWRDRGAPAPSDDGLSIDSDDADEPPRRVSAKAARKRVNNVFRRGVEGWRREAQPKYGDGTPVDKDDLLAAVHNRLVHWSKTKTLKAPARALHMRLSTGKRLTRQDDELMDRVFIYMSARR